MSLNPPIIGTGFGSWPEQVNNYLLQLDSQLRNIETARGITAMALELPTVSGDRGAWGAKINAALTAIDERIEFIESGGGLGEVSGFNTDGYGLSFWDGTTVTSSAGTLTANMNLYKPNYATVGWGKKFNDNFDAIEALNVRLIALETA